DPEFERHDVRISADAPDVAGMQKGDVQPPARRRKTARELMDVSGRVAFRVVAAIKVALQRRLDRTHLLRRDGATIESAGLEQRGDEARMLEPLAVTVDVENSLTAEVEVDPLAFRPFQQMGARRNREP